jgi:hypothetical protein
MFGQIGKNCCENPCERFVGLFKALDHSRNVFENTVRSATIDIHSDVFSGKGWLAAATQFAVRPRPTTAHTGHDAAAERTGELAGR